MNDNKCVFCGKKADWDNFGGICNDCYKGEEYDI